uniref:Uncharacterized protein n=1 Tax=Chenopodium quinoa TaxID=63459 RepID=A0A803LRK1_CHEQI
MSFSSFCPTKYKHSAESPLKMVVKFNEVRKMLTKMTTRLTRKIADDQATQAVVLSTNDFVRCDDLFESLVK